MQVSTDGLYNAAEDLIDRNLVAGRGDGVWRSSGRAAGPRLRRRHGHGRGRGLNGRGARPRDQP